MKEEFNFFNLLENFSIFWMVKKIFYGRCFDYFGRERIGQKTDIDLFGSTKFYAGDEDYLLFWKRGSRFSIGRASLTVSERPPNSEP
jgi:hypothetical protein